MGIRSGRMKRSWIDAAGASVGAGSLTAAAGWLLREAPPGWWPPLLAAVSAAAAAIALVKTFHNRNLIRQSFEKVLAQRELLLESVEVTPAPYALYDKSDVLVAWN